MKAGHGIIFKEGIDHVDNGPSYKEKIKSQGRMQSSLQDYRRKQSMNDFTNPGQYRIDTMIKTNLFVKTEHSDM